MSILKTDIAPWWVVILLAIFILFIPCLMLYEVQVGINNEKIYQDFHDRDFTAKKQLIIDLQKNRGKTIEEMDGMFKKLVSNENK